MDVLAVGDTTTDIFLQLHDASLQCNIDGNGCKVCLDYGDKIAVEEKKIIAGVGNAANHAIGVARLGCKAGIYTILGKDSDGEKAKEIFEKNGVDTTALVFDPAHETNLSVVIRFRSERTILVYHEPREYKIPDIDDPSWIYLTSASGDGVAKLHSDLLAFMDTHPKTKLAFNPGTHQIHLGKEVLLPVLQKTSVLFVNREEAARVSEIETRDVPTLMKAFHEMGISTVVITDGPEGSYASDGRSIYYVPIYKVKEVERTGAGDAYGSGFLAALVRGKSVPEAMQWGNANSSSVVQYVGAREGLLEEDALRAIIAEHGDVTPRIYDESHY